VSSILCTNIDGIISPDPLLGVGEVGYWNTHEYELPISIYDYNSIKKLLLQGVVLQFSGCGLYPDIEAGIIWGTDHYGCDGIASNDINDINQALRWVHYQDTRDDHPAECSH